MYQEELIYPITDKLTLRVRQPIIQDDIVDACINVDRSSLRTFTNEGISSLNISKFGSIGMCDISDNDYDYSKTGSSPKYPNDSTFESNPSDNSSSTAGCSPLPAFYEDSLPLMKKLSSKSDSYKKQEERVAQMINNLDFIDQPLKFYRMRAGKSQSLKDVSNAKPLTLKRGDSNLSAEDAKGRKNKCQVEFLQNEYTKNPNWTRVFMKSLAQKTGLKPSQIYKWNWDKKKKEIED